MNTGLEDADAFLDHLTDLFASRGGKLEVEGRLSNAAHMLQTAAAAADAGAEACLVAASLLHDIGHWLRGETSGTQSADHRHETVGAAHLDAYFDADVTRPIALHVAASATSVLTSRTISRTCRRAPWQVSRCRAARCPKSRRRRSRRTPHTVTLSPFAAGTSTARSRDSRCPASSTTGRCCGISCGRSGVVAVPDRMGDRTKGGHGLSRLPFEPGSIGPVIRNQWRAGHRKNRPRARKFNQDKGLRR